MINGHFGSREGKGARYEKNNSISSFFVCHPGLLVLIP